jgi:formate-dependent phosphoribosylglycinamide formyltransferase (GAR transformylase)
VVGATIVRAWGTAARAATALEDGVRDPGRRIMYNGPVLFDLTITFLVVRSFTDKPNGSNSIEHQLSVVKRRTERRL